jgi:hypothetical protein
MSKSKKPNIFALGLEPSWILKSKFNRALGLEGWNAYGLEPL